jgi:hypothetical protein
MESEIDVRQESRPTRPDAFAGQRSQGNTSRLSERFADQYSRNDCIIGKVPAQKVLITPDGPCCLHRAVAELANVVNEQERSSMRQKLFGRNVVHLPAATNSA